MHENIIIEKDG